MAEQQKSANSQVELREMTSRYMREPVPYAVITPMVPKSDGPLPLCLVLMGGGGSRQSLVESQAMFDQWWSEGLLPPMVLATPSAGMSYYHDHSDGSARWESFIVEDFLKKLRATCNVDHQSSATAITGISMGGYGALKIALSRPDQFVAVAAVQPILEPGLSDQDIGARNRIHHASGGPPELVGPQRDPTVFAANNPANRAVANARSIRESGLAIYMEVGDNDLVNAHDGVEFLHRVLWDLDISHEYHLVRGGDHGGPTLRSRMREAYAWVGAVVTAARIGSNPVMSETERPITEWIESGMKGKPPVVSPSSYAFLRMVRAQLQTLRDQAEASDPTTRRRYGVLPAVPRP